jgi:O-antigen/teichoic acid export membrane protein
VRLREIRLPLREVFSFTLPMMTTDLLGILNQSTVVLLLGYYHTVRDVAFFRAVLPAAAMNQTVAITWSVLYLPAAARLFASGNHEGLRQLYRRTAAWIAVASFPVLVITLGWARPLTILLYGPRYAGAAPLLAILAIGYYYDVVFGFNGLTLKALNKVGYVVGCNLAAAVTNIAASLICIPRYGALGAAIATALTVIVSTTARQVALGWAVGVSARDRKFLAFYVPVALAVVLLVAVYFVLRSNPVVAAMLGAASMGIVFLNSRKELNILEIFPESARIPFLKRFLANSAV